MSPSPAEVVHTTQSTRLHQDLTDGEIRLIHISRHGSVDAYRLRLYTAQLITAHQPRQGVSSGAYIDGQHQFYSAVSYTWRNHEQSEVLKFAPLVVFNDTIPYTLQVTQSTVDAIHDIATYYLDDGGWLWIDQICIDQLSVSDKSQQVSLMKSIYERASFVFAHLGPGSSSPERAMNTVLKHVVNADQDQHVDAVGSFWKYKSSVNEDQSSQCERGDWQAVESFIHNPWFRRAWVWPEVTAIDANDVFIICGSCFISLRWLKCFLLALSRSRLGVREDSSFIQSFWRVIAVVDHNIWMSNWRSTREAGANDPLLRLLNCVQGCNTSDPRDRIYCMLPYATDAICGSIALTADYSLSHQELSLKFVMWFIHKYQRLDFLGLCIVRDENSDWPTWVPDWSNKSITSPFSTHTREYKYTAPLYSPLGTARLRLEDTNAWHSDARLLALEGVRIGVIARLHSDEVKTEMEDSQTQSSFTPFQPANTCPFNKIPHNEVLLRTLCADVIYRGHDDDESTKEEPRDSNSVQGEDFERQQKEEVHGLYYRGPSMEEMSSGKVNFMDHSLCHQLFYTRTTAVQGISDMQDHASSSGLLGNGSVEMQPGDEIWALKGATMLHILSPVRVTGEGKPVPILNLADEKASSSVDADKIALLDIRQYIGECFILGLMDGEILQYMSGEKPKPAVLSDMDDRFRVVHLM